MLPPLAAAATHFLALPAELARLAARSICWVVRTKRSDIVPELYRHDRKLLPLQPDTLICLFYSVSLCKIVGLLENAAVSSMLSEPTL